MPIPEDPADAARRRIEEGIARREARDAARARAAQAAAGPPSTSSARAAQAAAGPPSTASARAAQAAAAPAEPAPTVRRETLPAIQGGGSGNGGGGGRAVVPDGNRPPVPGGGPGRALATVDNRIPINLRSAASTATSVAGRIAARGLGALGLGAGATPVARAQLTDTPEGRRMLAEHEAQRASDAAAGAAENYGGGAPASAAEVRREAQARTQARQATRPATRMSPRELTSDELHNIQGLTLDPESGIAEMRGVRGEAARNIIARRADQERQRELEAMKKGGPVKKMAKGGVVKSSASGRSDGCVTKGRTKGRMV